MRALCLFVSILSFTHTPTDTHGDDHRQLHVLFWVGKTKRAHVCLYCERTREGQRQKEEIELLQHIVMQHLSPPISDAVHLLVPKNHIEYWHFTAFDLIRFAPKSHRLRRQKLQLQQQCKIECVKERTWSKSNQNRFIQMRRALWHEWKTDKICFGVECVRENVSVGCRERARD